MNCLVDDLVSLLGPCVGCLAGRELVAGGVDGVGVSSSCLVDGSASLLGSCAGCLIGRELVAGSIGRAGVSSNHLVDGPACLLGPGMEYSCSVSDRFSDMGVPIGVSPSLTFLFPLSSRGCWGASGSGVMLMLDSVIVELEAGFGPGGT